tara:strand:- start:4184 stop:5128 length:945 start_codon:yes stop_codon:yes gene_type:complete
MILKDISLKNTISPTAKAGQEQEKNVAFFLRRAFKDHSSIFVINDYKFTYNFETAQIDHLIVYPYGFILIESKSITGEVKVNSFSEWSRSFNNKWSGMPSPIKQVELQQRLLRELLFENREKILCKLLGIKQQSFGFRCWDNICVVSSNAIIDRESMPNDVSEQLVKSEFLVDKLNKVMNFKSALGRFLTLTDSRPKFSDAEMESITEFIMSQIQIKAEILEEKRPVIEAIVHSNVEPIVKITSRLQCKNCGESSDYTALSGRYGYYIKCNKCTTNTAMKMNCGNCQSKNAKVSKLGETYFLNCGDCETSKRLL